MDTSTIAVITGLLQVAGTIVVIKIQQNQIAGLRANINDQKSSIEALKTQAEGQVSLTGQQQALTSQMSQLMSGVLADAEKRLAIVKETAALEAQAIQKELKQAKSEIEEQKVSQLQQLASMDEQPAMTELLTKIVEENYNTKDQIASLDARISDFFLRSDAVFQSLLVKNKNTMAIENTLGARQPDDLLMDFLLLPWNKQNIIDFFNQNNFDYSLSESDLTKCVDYISNCYPAHPSNGIDRQAIAKVVNILCKEWHYYTRQAKAL